MAERVLSGTDGMDAPAARVDEGNWLFQRLPQSILESFSAEQRAALHDAVTGGNATAPPVNIRFSLPFLGRRVYIAVIGGPERRTRERLARERLRYPLRTAANALFFFGLATLFYVIALLAFGLYSAVIEF